jgi:hypothetical protein
LAKENKPSPFLQNIIEELTAGLACGFELCQTLQVWQRKTNHASSHIKLKGILTAGKPALSNFAKPMRFGKGELGLAKEN